MKSKKGEIGETIAWIFAFIIILFVIGLFLGATGLLAKSKSVPVFSWLIGTGENEISIEKSGRTGLYMQDGMVLMSVPIKTGENSILLRDIVFVDNIDVSSVSSTINDFLSKHKLSAPCSGIVYEFSGKNFVLEGNLPDSFIREKAIYIVSGSKGKLFSYAGECS